MDTHDSTPEKDEPAEADVSASWPPWALGFLAALEKNPNVSKAATAAGINRATAYNLRQRDEAFALAWHDAHEEALDLLEEVIYASATAGLPHTKTVRKLDPEGNTLEITETEEIVRNPTLAMFFLKRYRPEFRESFRVEQTGPGGGPIQHELTLVEEASKAAQAELDRLYDEAHPELPVIDAS